MEPTWEIYDAAMPFAGTHYGSQRVRMVIIGLGEKDLLVVTPGAPLDDARWAKLNDFGKPRYLLAPNHFHNMGILPWKERYPDAQVIAHARSLPRLKKKLKVDVTDVSTIDLPSHVRVFGPPGAKQGEVIVSIRTSEGLAWFVTDAIMNPHKLPLFMRILGFRTGLSGNPFFKRLFLEDRKGFVSWLCEALERDRPTIFVPSHGDVIRADDLADRLARIYE